MITDEDITTPKRKRKLEDEESIEKENGYEEEDFEENEEKKMYDKMKEIFLVR